MRDDTPRIATVNTNCIVQAQETCATKCIAMESANASTPLRKAREKAGFAKASDFAERYGFPESTYRSHDNGTRELTISAAKRYAARLGVSWLDLMGEDAPAGSGKVAASRFGIVKQREREGSGTTSPQPGNPVTNVGGETLRVLGMAEGGADGWAPFNGETVEFVRKPDNLLGVPNAYGVYLTGTSMVPTYYPGWLLHIHPGKPLNQGCFVLVQRKPQHEGEAPLAVVKRLVRRTATKLVLEQSNPAKTIEVPVSEVMSVHRVVGSSEG